MGVPSLRAARKMSPVEICGIPSLSTSFLACVPLPEPGPPNSTILMLPSCFRGKQLTPPLDSARSDESFIMSLNHMGFDLTYSVQGDPHDNQQRGSAEIKGRIKTGDQNRGEHTYQ